MKAAVRSTGRAVPYLVIAAVGVALMAPGLRGGPMVQDSFWIDIVWAKQFTELLRQGVVYPRWLPASFDGLGSPVFYFYGPIAFYLTGLFGLLGFSTYGSILAAFSTAMLASGLSMYRWLKGWTGQALAGACLYMAAPYHLIDFHRRGALAEFTAFALIPLIALALKRSAEQRKIGMLAVIYALLIMTHLPMALLTSLLLILPLGIAAGWRDRNVLLPIITCLALGIGIAGIYLLPALLLQQHIAIDRLWIGTHLQADNWSFLTPARWPDRSGGLLIVCLTMAVVIPAALVFWVRRDFWSGLTLLCCAVVAGLIPFFWSLPIIAKVQFPWRALAIAEFAVATALAASRLRPTLLFAASVPMLTISALFLIGPAPPGEHKFADIARLHPDVPEYLPAGSPPEIGSASRWALGLAAAQPPVVTDGDRTILRRFYFPAWQVRCGAHVVPTFPDPATRLVSYRGRGCAVEKKWTRPEIAGLALSLISLLLLLALTCRPNGFIRSDR